MSSSSSTLLGIIDNQNQCHQSVSSIKVISTVISVSSSASTLPNIISDLHRLCSQCHHHQLHQLSVQCHHIQNFSKYSTLSFLGVARWRGCGEPCLFLEGSSFWGLCSLSKDTKFPWGWGSSGRLRSAGDRLSQVLLLTFGKKVEFSSVSSRHPVYWVWSGFLTDFE